MSVRSNRIAYGLTAAVLAVLLYLFGSPVLLLALLLLGVLAVAMGVGLRHDTAHVRLECRTRGSCLAGRELELRIFAERDRMLLAGRCVYMRTLIHNAMTGAEQYKTLVLPLWGKGDGFSLKFSPANCGELTITCEKAWLGDHLELFSLPLPGFAPVRTTVYPPNVSMEVILDRQNEGKTWEDGPMLNRPGTDKSETYDVRDYRQGDDVRAIHWKLSVKEDNLIVRIPGSPGFFDMVLLADFGKNKSGVPTAPEKRNSALAYGSAVLQQMVRKGVRCCLALPGSDGMTLLPVESRQDYRQAMAQWMATPLPENTGDAVRLFRSERLEGRFARMLLLNLDGLTEERPLVGSAMAVTVLSVIPGAAGQTREVGSLRVTELPAPPDRETVYRLYC